VGGGVQMKFLSRKKDGPVPESAQTRLELLYHISREFAAALDLHTVLQRVLFLSVKNVGAISGSVIVLDDQGAPVESALIFRDTYHQHTTQQLKETLDRGLAGWVAQNRQAVLVEDTSKDLRWVRRPDDAPDRTGPKSAVSVPILARDHLVGVITLVNSEPGYFTDEHFVLIQAIADLAGIAILNARLYEESQRQARVMTAVAESTAVITATLNLDDVFQRILEQVSHALQVEAVSLALIDPQREVLDFRASTGLGRQNVVGLQLSVGKGVAGWVAQQGQAVIVPNAYEDSRFYPEIDQSTGFITHAIACSPIISRGQVIGILEAINPRRGAFDQDSLLLLNGVSNLAGTAIHHAQLFERLQAAHQRYRELFEDSIDPIVITDWNGYILEANRQAKLTIGRSEDDLRHMLISDIHKVDQDKIGASYEELASGKTISYESALHVRDRQDIPVQVYARKVQIEGVSHLQWILRDITERKDLDNLREELLSMIYHDLRSPLGNIVSSLDVLDTLLPENGDNTPRSLLNIAMRSTERIQRLTNSLLDINRLEAGQPVVNPQTISVLVLIHDAVDAVIPMSQTKEQQITILAGNLPEVLADGDMIRRVMINLLENAVKYSPAKGIIRLGAELNQGQVSVWVQDDGPGIPTHEHERIFEKFTRLRAKDGSKGLGLGLAYCRLAVLAHGGQIWVESVPGNGSTFTFTLPVAFEQHDQYIGGNPEAE
jgi:NtrC-family two-component system sensor histidine kinase KinB